MRKKDRVLQGHCHCVWENETRGMEVPLEYYLLVITYSLLTNWVCLNAALCYDFNLMVNYQDGFNLMVKSPEAIPDAYTEGDIIILRI